MGPRLARWFFFGAMAAAAAIILIGRAVDQQLRTEEHIITTKDGRTVDCRVDHRNGSIYLNDCNYVRVP